MLSLASVRSEQAFYKTLSLIDKLHAKSFVNLVDKSVYIYMNHKASGSQIKLLSGDEIANLEDVVPLPQ